jgi:hypothetical protein
MEKRLKRRIVVGGIAVLAVAGAGGAIAARQLGSPQERSQAIVVDAAKQLGIPSAKLSDALKKAVENQIDAAVQAGQLTKEQGADLKARIESGEAPLFGGGPSRGGPGHHFSHFVGLETAADYLGLTGSELRTQLRDGKTLAQIAKDRGKSVDGLIGALYDAAKKQLDAAVAAGRLTKDQEDKILADAKQRITDFVNGNGPKFRDHFGDRLGSGDRFGPGFRPGFGDRLGPGRFGRAGGYGPPLFAPPTT